jgi:hypothetical protein
MLELRAAEDRLIHRPSWIDPGQGTLRIPIDLAIDVVTRRGLPEVATPPVTPASPAPPIRTGGKP